MIALCCCFVLPWLRWGFCQLFGVILCCLVGKIHSKYGSFGQDWPTYILYCLYIVGCPLGLDCGLENLIKSKSMMTWIIFPNSYLSYSVSRNKLGAMSIWSNSDGIPMFNVWCFLCLIFFMFDVIYFGCGVWQLFKTKSSWIFLSVELWKNYPSIKMSQI